MFHAPMGRFQLELMYYFTIFPPSSHPTVENVGITMKDLQERNIQLLDGMTVERQNNKLI